MEKSDSSASLADDDLSNRISGMLSFTADDTRQAALPRDSSTANLEAALDGSNTSLPASCGVAFEVDNYRIVGEGRSKHVLYSVIILRTKQIDSQPDIIERRYSDFESLYSSLKKKFHRLMGEISFPKKVVTGNFKPETIAQRSRAFEQVLCHIYSMVSLRNSQEFVNFFYGDDLRLAYKAMRNSNYEAAMNSFKNSLGIQRKLLGDSHPGVVATLCGLCAGSNTLDKIIHAHMYSELALQCLGQREDSKYLVSLLQLTIRLCWQLGKDKSDLERRLGDLRGLGMSIDSAPSLLEVVVSESTWL